MGSGPMRGGTGFQIDLGNIKTPEQIAQEEAAKKQAFEAETADQSRVSNRLKREFGQAPSQLQSDLISGSKFGEAVVGEGLGRLSDDPTLAGIQERLQERSKGLEDKQAVAMREKAASDILSKSEAGRRRLQAALARSGVKGAAAGTQLTQQAVGTQQQLANLERDMIIQQRDAERQGLQDLAKFAGETKQFDLAQQAKEKNIALQGGLGFAQLGAAERGAKIQADASKQAAQASAPSCHVAGTLVLMADNTRKPIEELVVGDEVFLGGKVKGRGEKLREEELYTYGGEIFTASHLVFCEHSENFIEAQEHPQCTKIEVEEGEYEVVYPIFTENSIYYTTFLNGDFGFETMVKELKKEDMIEAVRLTSSL